MGKRPVHRQFHCCPFPILQIWIRSLLHSQCPAFLPHSSRNKCKSPHRRRTPGQEICVELYGKICPFWSLLFKGKWTSKSSLAILAGLSELKKSRALILISCKTWFRFWNASYLGSCRHRFQKEKCFYLLWIGLHRCCLLNGSSHSNPKLYSC